MIGTPKPAALSHYLNLMSASHHQVPGVDNAPPHFGKIERAMKNIPLIAVSIAVLTGCSTGIRGTQYELKEDSSAPPAGFGIVFGRICEGNGLGFRSLSDQSKELLHIGGKTSFALQLPEGKYVLYQLGSPTGRMVSDQPFEFSVASGGLQYIGSLIPRWNNAGHSRFPGSCNEEEAHVVKTVFWSNKGLAGTSQPVFAIGLANHLEGAVADARRYYPKVNFDRASVSLMK